MNKTKLSALATFSIATTLFLTSGIAQANSLSILGPSAISFTGYNGQPSTVTGSYSSGFLGTLVANAPGTISFTYLGNESGFINSFSFGGFALNESNAVGDTIAPVSIGAGAVDFAFSDNQGGSISNGTASTPTLGFAILDGNVASPNGGSFDFVLGFNDSSTNDADYDDFVVGVNYATISPVPLPTSLPLLAASLGIFTLASRRRV
ncbi:MAG: VPLPA-CTERM sorting domain-containing protein [Pseudomonadota bacterium]